MLGSPSSAPRRIEISSPSGHHAPKRLEPHTEQNAFTAPPSGRYVRISSSPWSNSKPLRATRACVNPNVPECLRQREQWQWLARRNGIVTRKRTPPQRQPPEIGSIGPTLPVPRLGTW